MNIATRSFIAAMLAMSYSLPRPARLRISAPNDLPSFIYCRAWRRRKLDLAKRLVRQDRLR